ncbi:MAG TPA: outer membrane lipoprotein carrier protein LolA [Gammaproteobacteria bacterium]|nr:outer membrane lipoprotein carrier protein LolA [Gammaproteobacteria bacterium]
MKKFMKKLIFSLLLLIFSGSVFASAPIAQIQAMLDKSPILCGNFNQTKTLIGISKPLLSNGTFCVNAKTGVVWKTLHPFPNTVKLTRDDITQIQGNQTVMQLSAQQEPVVKMINSVLFSLLAGDFSQLDKTFILNGNIKNNTWHVSLVARDKALAKVIGNITLDGNTHVNKVMIHESNGDQTLITFSDIKNHA